MDLEKRESGLVVPKQKPQPKRRQYGPLEIQDDDKRGLAVESLCNLWDAMDLSISCGGIRLPDKPGPEKYETYYRVYRFMGELLLGDDCPEKEVLT